MTKDQISAAPRRRVLTLWGLLILQASCALFFLADVISDLLGMEDALGGVDHHNIELIVVLALGLGVIFIGFEIRRVLNRHRRMEFQLRAASGAFWELLEEHFDGWSLTPSERDVATLAIKGLSIAEIASIRQTKQGTIKAQCNAIYAKAGVSGRPQLLSLFIEDLMSEDLVGQIPE
ncbi:MAG: helix-turn-helix transcriptional regulator [Hyphomicrobiales bacterium]|nr:helix-turn-helix transcriptional regulator [Hyphomicrobiales bacterium]